MKKFKQIAIGANEVGNVIENIERDIEYYKAEINDYAANGEQWGVDYCNEMIADREARVAELKKLVDFITSNYKFN